MPKSHLDWFAVASFWVGGLVFTVKSIGPPLMPGAPAFLAANFWNYVPLVLISIALALFLYRLWRPAHLTSAVAPTVPEVDSAELRLQVPARLGVTPTRLGEAKNVFRWYWLAMIGSDISDPSNIKEIPFATTLFVTFDPVLRAGTLIASSPDMTLPRYEVKDFNARSAVIVFQGQVPQGTLVVTAH